MKHYDVVIVGGGATGASTLFHLAQLGITNTLLIEKKEGFGRGATGSWGSLVRVMHQNLNLTTRASRSVAFHRDFEKQTGQPSKFSWMGSLYFIHAAQRESFSKHFEIMRDAGIEFHLVGPQEGKLRFPEFTWYEDDLAIFEPNAGVACPWSMTEGFIKSACEKGAEAKLNARVVDLETDASRVTHVRTSEGEEFGCDFLILATGIWTPNMIEKLGSHVAIHAEVIQLNRFCRQNFGKSHPLFIDLKNRTFGHPSFNGSLVGGYLKDQPKETEKKKAVQHVSLHEANIAKHKLALRMPWIKSSTLEGGLRAIDSYTTSKMGVIAYDEKFKNLLVSAGWSCGGFTTSPENGRMIASMVPRASRAADGPQLGAVLQ